MSHLIRLTLLGLTLCTWLLVTTATARAERIFIPAAANNPYTGILFADDFSDATSGWQMGEDDYVRNGYVEGEYEILLKRDGSLLSFYYPHTFTDYSYQVDARLLPSNASRAYGIVFGLINLKNYVAFIVDNQQLFAVHRLTDNQWTVLHDWQPLPFALGDLAAANRFRVDHSGDSYVIYINDQEVVRGTDPQLLRPHGMGVALTITNFTPNESITVRYDNLEVRALLE